MTTLVKKYPVFEDNQVLTSSQLNSLVEYLDQQNRLTRVSLIGVGILCGLNLSCETVDGKEQLTISGGVGVTSEGYLIKTINCVNTKLRNYTLPEGVQYPPFQDPLIDEQDVTLLELLTETADFDEQDEIAPIVKSEINDMVVMLFVECLDKDLKSCLGKSCDQLGIDRFLTIRKLLVSRTDYAKIIARTEGGYQDAQFPDQFNLPKVVMPRTLFFPNEAHSKSYLHYSVNYLPGILGTSSSLFAALRESYEVYEPILEPIYGSNPFETFELEAIVQNWIAYLFGADGSPLPFLGMQYFSDFIKDLTQAYSEFRENACLLTSLCCPDMDRFPKHLTLGVIDQLAKGNVTTEFRHQFTQPPVYGNQKGLSKKVVELHQKLVGLIESFDLDRLRKSTDLQLEIKITPSDEKKSLMSERSIPYYYDITKNSSFEKLGPFEEIWTASQKSKFGRDVLSYEKNQPADPVKDPVRTPLDFDLDPFDFLRIEGHVGKPVKQVLGELEKYKRAKNLAFDVKPIYLGANGLAIDIPDCICTDLQPDYSIWRNKTLFFFKSLLVLTTRLGNLVNKRTNVTSAFLSGFRADKSTFSSAGTGTDTGSNVNAGPPIATRAAGPIKINQAKLTNFSDIQINVTKDNWHLAGKQLVGSLDKFAAAEKAPNDSKTFVAFAEKKTAKDYFDFFNNCLCKLIDSMKINLKEFNLNEWKKHYACTFQTHINIMKQLAEQSDNSKANLQAYIILVVYCAVYKALSMLAIYPYISIGVIAQTLDFRKDKFLASLNFSNFIKKHPGIEHKAGVEPGGTFLLLYLAEESKKIKDGIFTNENGELLFDKEDGLFGLKNFDIPDGNIKPEEISGMVEKFKDVVIGDFTLPYQCCDDCGDMPNAALPLNPLGLPVCGVVITNFNDNNEQKLPFFGDYRPLNIKMISYVYESETFRTRLVSDPKFGTVDIKMIDSTFEFNIVNGTKGEPRKIEQMTYTVDVDRMSAVFKKNPDTGILVDEFEYEFFNDRDPENTICKSTISIFIPLISRTVDEQKSAKVTGRVILGNEPLFNASVAIKDNSNIQPQTTSDEGVFSFPEVPEGTMTFVVTHQEIITKEEEASITSPETNIGDIIVQRRGNVFVAPIDFGKMFKTLDVKEETPEALKVINYYIDSTNRYKMNMELLAKNNDTSINPVLLRSNELVGEMTDKPEIQIDDLNARFVKAMTEVDGAMVRINDAELIVLREAMNNITLSYFQRLSVVEPSSLSNPTITILRKASKTLTKKKYPELSKSVDQWLDKSRGHVGDEFLASIKDNFKLVR
jgi:hypothetical protein